MYIDHIWPFTTFISRNKHNKNIRLRLYWLRLRVAEAEVQTSHLVGVKHQTSVWTLRVLESSLGLNTSVFCEIILVLSRTAHLNVSNIFLPCEI